MAGRDVQRSRVYAAERFVRTLFDRAAEHGSGALEFFGAQLTLPPEGRFASVESVQRYVDDVLALVREQWPDAQPVAVRRRRGVSAAHYERSEVGAVIAVPDHTGTWALREWVVLHEIAHHLCSDTDTGTDTGEAEPAHGPRFTATMRELAAAVMGPEAGHVLGVVYAREGVR